MLIIEQSKAGRSCSCQIASASKQTQIPDALLRQAALELPEVSELQVVRHYTRLSQKNFSIDTQFYPLGSCTMKYNPKVSNTLASLSGFSRRHPFSDDQMGQGVLACLHELQLMLKNITGMQAISLTPAAGAQGEFAGVAMIKAYHTDRNDLERDEILVPCAAHGTNPASAVMCGYKIKEIPTKPDGDIDLDALRPLVSSKTAGIMLTNPSTFGLFEREIKQIASMVHDAGGLLYYDGANLNAILGKVRPGDMGFDVIHINLHKTFSTPHGGGGPGSGPVGVSERLAPYLPIPIVGKKGDTYYWQDKLERPKSIGRLSAFMGNVGVLIRAYVYARVLGHQGMVRVAEYSTLNANYLMKKLTLAGFDAAFPQRRATHEFIITLKRQAKTLGVSTMDVAKRLLDYGYHAPTTYFPLIVPECLLIEPTETETKDEIDGFVGAMEAILHEAQTSPEKVKSAPYNLPVKRLDDVRAARELNLTWKDSNRS